VSGPVALYAAIADSEIPAGSHKRVSWKLLSPVADSNCGLGVNICGAEIYLENLLGSVRSLREFVRASGTPEEAGSTQIRQSAFPAPPEQ